VTNAAPAGADAPYALTLLDEPATSAPLPPARAGVRSIRPNPFTTSTVIDLAIGRAASAAVTVHDVRGRRVRTLASGAVAPGRAAAVWDGRDEEGRPVAPGVYWVRVPGAPAASARAVTRLR
jgi:hypothetical protein